MTKSAEEIRAALQGVNIYLVGMMGSGKTTVGRHLAKLLRYRFFDTDQVVEKVTGKPITQLFAESGEAEFRHLETQVLSSICAYQRSVIATGGGIVLAQKNWSYLHYGAVVWLDVPIDVLYERVSRDSSRPLLQHPDPRQVLTDILAERRSLYAQADLRFTVGENGVPREVAQQLVVALDSIVKPPSDCDT
ncbi:MAG: shikimate kinase [Cyanobacteria bacterium P01_A01_bin.135]